MFQQIMASIVNCITHHTCEFIEKGYETHCESEHWKGHIDPSHPYHPWDKWFKQNWTCMDGMKSTTSKYDI